MAAVDQEKFARAVQGVARALSRVGRERARTNDMTPQQAETLQLVAEHGAVSTSALATLLGIDPSTASRNLAGLEREGYVTRRKGTDDARQTDVRLTPRGKRAADQLASETAELVGSIFDKIPRNERARLVEAFEVFASAAAGAQQAEDRG